MKYFREKEDKKNTEQSHGKVPVVEPDKKIHLN